MRVRLFLLAAVACSPIPPSVSAGSSPAPPAPLVLAEGSKALFPVVVAKDASPRTRLAAEDLARYLSRMSGAAFTVTAGDGARGIVVGTLAEFPDPRLEQPLALRGAFDGKEAFAIRTEKGRLRLVGRTELGASHAVYRLLEHLGCRWLFPAPEWEVVPTHRTLRVALDETDRPALLSRRIWYGHGYFDRAQRRCQEDHEAWARRNRMDASLRIHCGHAWQSIILNNKKLFEEHPEYLALVKGKRQEPQLCVSSPEVRRLVVGHALDQLKRFPDRDMVSLETSDGSNHCECEHCQKLGPISDRVFGLANEAARAVARAYPGKMIGMLAYNDHCEPPSFPLEPNVYVQPTAGFIRGRYTFDELMEAWPRHCKSLGFYEYFSVWPWDFDMPARGRAGNIKALRERIPHYHALGATSLDCESSNNWGPHGRGYLVANRLMWDPRADVDALLADFYEKAFGPAAAVMRRYYERLDPGNEPLVSSHLLGLALRDLEEASRLARDRPDVLARLAHLEQYMHYVRLRWQYERSRDKKVKRDAAVAALEHCYRTRYSYMNHWAAMFFGWSQALAKEFDEPALAWNSKETPPWKNERPMTPEETERLFQDDLAYFRPETIQERAFTQDLVPAGLRSEKPAVSRQRYQRTERYALYSREGKPLSFTIQTGVIAWYRDRPELTWKVTDAAGKEVGRGRLPQDGKDHPLTVKVPGAGLYWLEANDQAAGWALEVAAGEPVALALKRATRHLHLGQMQPMYFWVPPGTTEIHYFWDGSPHDVFGPDGKLVARVETSGVSVKIPVPPGADGKAWSLRRLALGHLWLYNVPAYLAASPDALLVPGEALARQP